MLIRAQGMRYRQFLNQLHDRYEFDWYLEVGCRRGDSFRDVRSKTIGVDPNFQIKSNVIGRKSALLLFQQTSDDFFGSGFLKQSQIKIDFSFLDGMHLFEFLLRDFINTEANAHASSVIALHDCCPYTVEMTTRDLQNLPRGAWTGDVWKLLPILREFRPDLEVTVLDADPTGLVLVSNLDPSSTVLTENYDEIIQRYSELDLETYGTARFAEAFPMTSTAAYLHQGPTAFGKTALQTASG